MKFCFFYFLCLFIIYFLSKNLISARLIRMLIDLCCCLCLGLYIYIYIRLGHGLGPEVVGWTGPARPVVTRRAGFGAKKKTRLLNGPGSGNK